MIAHRFERCDMIALNTQRCSKGPDIACIDQFRMETAFVPSRPTRSQTHTFGQTAVWHTRPDPRPRTRRRRKEHVAPVG